MIPRHYLLSILCLLLLGLSACTEGGAGVQGTQAYFTQKDDDVCDPSDGDYDPNDPRCLAEGPGGTGVEPAVPCEGMNNPTCHTRAGIPGARRPQFR